MSEKEPVIDQRERVKIIVVEVVECCEDCMYLYATSISAICGETGLRIQMDRGKAISINCPFRDPKYVGGRP